jgi:hypothetical protein
MFAPVASNVATVTATGAPGVAAKDVTTDAEAAADIATTIARIFFILR